MESKFLTITFCLFIFVASVFAQEEMVKLDEFGNINCEDILARSDYLLNEINANPNAIVYIVFYEGKHKRRSYKKNGKINIKLINPKRGEARDNADDIIFYINK